MIKVVSKHVAQPFYWVMCDIKECAMVSIVPLEEAARTSQAGFEAVRNGFLTKLRENGWFLDFEGQFCPECKRDLERAAVQRNQLVQPATHEDVAKWDGKGMRLVEKVAH